MTNIAIMGFGVVGSGVAQTLMENADSISQKYPGLEINIKYILDLRKFPEHPLGDRVVDDINIILNDESVKLVVETMGGTKPAFDFSKRALESGKSVVTSNKEVVEKHGAELFRIAKEKGVSYLCEASVGGGIPIIRPLNKCLSANKIVSICGILNGTCNYILTKMLEEKADYNVALSQAQALGYAERDPSADVEGHDTCRKICILSSIAFGKKVSIEDVVCEGITEISYDDLTFAKNIGCSIKLLGLAKTNEDGKISVITAPFMIPKSHMLANINDVYNGICVVGNMVGDVSFIGKGAGSLPTASAVSADVVDALGAGSKMNGWTDEKADLSDVALEKVRFYVRTTASDDNIRSIFGNVDITINGENAMFITPELVEKDLVKKLLTLDGKYSKIRLM